VIKIKDKNGERTDYISRTMPVLTDSKDDVIIVTAEEYCSDLMLEAIY
jgi:hypothetical protein